MITIFRSLHAKKMHTMSGVLPAPMTWLVFTLLLSSVAAAAETVKVITTPVFTQIPRLQASKDFQVLVRVEAPPAVQQQRRVPVDLAVVLDVGGGGGTLDAVKKAVKFIIWQIIHEDDRLAVVGPSSSSITWLLGPEATGFLNTRDARCNAESSVDKLAPRGEFTSGAGAGAVLEEVVKNLRDLPPTASQSSRARFVILVTDTATTAPSSTFSTFVKDDLAPVVVHTLGLGAAHDPSTLSSIAKESQGTYSFVDDENMDNITGAIAVCLSGLKDVVAVGTRVLFETPVESEVTIESIDSGEYSNVTTAEKTSGKVAVGILSAGEVKSFLVHLSVPALSSSMSCVVDSCCDKQQLLNVTASFVVGHYTISEGDPAPPAATASAQAILYVQRPPPEALDGGALQKVPIPVVTNHIARFEVLEMVTVFFRKEISITVEVVQKLRRQWEQFVLERQFWSGLDLAALDVEVSRMVSSLEAAAAAAAGTISGSSTTAYILSWLSSYQMQRPTAMGSPNIVAAAFVTVNMQLMLQQAIDGPVPICNNGDCPECVCPGVSCVDPLLAPVLVPSGREDDTYRVVNTAYPPSVLVGAMNLAMKQMYQALVQANKLKLCDAAAGGVKVPQPAPLPQA